MIRLANGTLENIQSQIDRAVDVIEKIDNAAHKLYRRASDLRKEIYYVAREIEETASSNPARSMELRDRKVILEVECEWAYREYDRVNKSLQEVINHRIGLIHQKKILQHLGFN